jgi:hypothetical protein
VTAEEYLRAAFREYREDVAGGADPQPAHKVGVAPEVLAQFQDFLSKT